MFSGKKLLCIQRFSIFGKKIELSLINCPQPPPALQDKWQWLPKCDMCRKSQHFHTAKVPFRGFRGELKLDKLISSICL